MPAINHNWLNSHALRKYPIDDAATCVDDNGRVLPDDIILDLHISWPVEYGMFAFIGGVTITSRLVSVVIMAATSTDSAAEFIPLGAVSLLQPVSSNVQHPIVATATGVGGFIMFGDTDEFVSLRFSTAAQSRITSRTAAPYNTLPVRTIGKLGRADTLTGLVQLLAGNDLQIETSSVIIDGITTDAIVLQLTATASDNTLQKYIGPCGVRPESGNCSTPGIETIGGVSPDCDGNIDIVFRQLVVGEFPECNSIAAGMVLDQGVALADVCAARIIIDYGGTDLCADSSIPAEPSIPGSEGSLPSDSSETGSESSVIVICAELPFIDCFAGGIHEDWVRKSGSYNLTTLANPDTPEECCVGSLSVCDDSGLRLYNLTRYNLMVWNSCGYTTTVGQTITTDVRLTSGIYANGGILLNRKDSSGATPARHWIAGIDATDNKAKLWRLSTSGLLIEESTVSLPSVSFTKWYRLTVVITDLFAGNVAIALNVALAENPGVSLAAFTLSTTLYGTPDGKHGVATNRAVATFDYWSIS